MIFFLHFQVVKWLHIYFFFTVLTIINATFHWPKTILFVFAVTLFHEKFSSLLYICMNIFLLIFMHSRPFLQSTGGTELLIHSSYIICFVSNFNLFRPLFSWKLLLLQFENASRNFAGLMFICFASHLTKLISLISSPTNSLTMLCKSSNFFYVFEFSKKLYSVYSFLI